MGISKEVSQQFISELNKSEVIAEFFEITGDSNKIFPIEKVDRLGSKETIWKNVRPCSITINKTFTTPIYSENVDPKYKPYLESMRGKVFEEIDNNINLRIGKWDIANYLTNLEFELVEIRNRFEKTYVEEIEDHIFKNSNIKVKIIGYLIRDFEIEEMDIILSKYWEIQINVIETLLRIIETRRSIIEKTNDYVKEINSIPSHLTLEWERSDTDLLEVIIALFEEGAIQNVTKNLTQIEVIQIFSDLFGLEIKDPYKKLNSARLRETKNSEFTLKLHNALKSYYQRQDDKN